MRLPVVQKGDTRCPLSAGEKPQLLEARRRAGTLMGGETAGGQGEVRIWAPQRQRPRQLIGPVLARLVYAIIVGAILFLPWLHLPSGTFLTAMWTLLGAAAVASIGTGVAAKYSLDRRLSRLRPSYLSTDDAGLAFVTGARSLALPWEEIIGLRRLGSNALYLYTRSSGPQSISLAGFALSDVTSLASLIQAHADLVDANPCSPDMAALFRFLVRPGPLYTRRGETLESLRAPRDGKCLPEPDGGRSSESHGGPGTDETWLR